MQDIFYSIDRLLILAYRLHTGFAAFDFWAGTLCLAFCAVVLGECILNCVYYINRRHYVQGLQDAAKMNNISIEALKYKDKKAFTGANKMANEYFGRSFFSRLALFSGSLLPAFLALSWLNSRFSGITVHTLFNSLELGFGFVFVVSYIMMALFFSTIKKYLPFFGPCAALRTADYKKVEFMSMRSLHEEKTSEPPPSLQKKDSSCQ